MPAIIDGPASSCFSKLSFTTGLRLDELSPEMISLGMIQAANEAPRGECVAWGIPFTVSDVVLVKNQPVSISFDPFHAEWLVFMQASDERPLELNTYGFVSPMKGAGQLNEHAADYCFLYEDGQEERVQIRQRHQVCSYLRKWGANGLECVPAHKPYPIRASHEQNYPYWGLSQTRLGLRDKIPWLNWLWAWQNPHPYKKVVGIRFEPVNGTIVVSAVSKGNVNEHPLRWYSRRKVLLRLSEGETFNAELDAKGQLAQIKLDLGQVISAQPRLVYPNENWQDSYNNQLPVQVQNEILIEYTAHQQANFHLSSGQIIPAAEIYETGKTTFLEPVASSNHRVNLKVIAKHSGKLVAAKLHIHAGVGEYLPPVDRHRMINTGWFEDYSVDFGHQGLHPTSYIPGETLVSLPLGKVYIEISKGFEIRPVRKVIEILPSTEEIIIEVESVLPWREKGWVTADTHVHFLSPVSAMLEGAGEGVNVVNLLASQWGELMTNVGDFDGKTTWGEYEVGGGPEGNGEYLVRIGTENRQHVLGHISLLGYQGRVIAPITVGGPDESALGDPIEALITDWARQCKAQGGIVVVPHFPYPRAENAASIVSGEVDAIEMTSWGNLYGGIDPYSLSDWYRYLNCGYLVAAVGGTDKMAATTAIGTVRTYARLGNGQPFTYAAWMDAIRRAETFVTYGPLVEFSVEGKPAGSQISMSAKGGTVDVSWRVDSVTIPMSSVDLIINGAVCESAPVSAENGSGAWSVHVNKSSWVALLVRGHYSEQPEIIAAHTSPVFVHVEGSEMLAAADAVTILEQIEGSIAYLDTIGTRAEDQNYKRMRMVMTSSYRSLHNRMHQAGKFHDHNAVMGHEDGHIS